jgi:nicotinamidase-related amidase
MASALRFRALGPGTVHLCTDMQTLFIERTDWHVPWLELTRFVPPERPEDAAGAWRRYYARWRHMTGERLAPRLIQLGPTLAALVPPATVIDKAHYSPFKEQAFLRFLARLGADAMIRSGGETEVCVLAAVMDAVDAGYRVILAEDALCSASDESHDAMLRQFGARFSQQIGR